MNSGKCSILCNDSEHKSQKVEALLHKKNNEITQKLRTNNAKKILKNEWLRIKQQ